MVGLDSQAGHRDCPDLQSETVLELELRCMSHRERSELPVRNSSRPLVTVGSSDTSELARA